MPQVASQHSKVKSLFRGRRLSLRLLLGAVALACAAPRVSAEELPEANAKAAFVFNLTQFVSWPGGAASQEPFKIGVLGPDPFGSILDRLVAGESAGGRSIVVERASFPAQLVDCQLVYVSSGAAESLPRILAAFKGHGVLIVGESPDFLSQGGMVRLFRTPERKLRLQINLDAVQAVGLKMSSQLLRVADVHKGARR